MTIRVEPLKTVPADPSRAVRRVCAIGSSWMGAVYRAYTNSGGVDGFEFGFFANPANTFDDIRFEGTLIAATEVSNGASRDMRDYDVFVVYADLPMPHHLGYRDKQLARGPYSAQLRPIALRDFVLQTGTMKIVTQLQAIADKPIYLLSRNLPITMSNQPQASWDWLRGNALLEELTAPAVYIPYPPALLSEGLTPKPEYYRGSLNVAGVEPDREKQPDHYIDHLNEAGGALMLAHIVSYLRRPYWAFEAQE